MPRFIRVRSAPNDLAFLFAFDLDQNPATGTQPPNMFALGGDVNLLFNALLNPAEARIRGVFVPVSFGVDELSIMLSLDLLQDDGLANFGVLVGDPTGVNTFSGFDLFPDNSLGQPIEHFLAAHSRALVRSAGGRWPAVSVRGRGARHSSAVACDRPPASVILTFI